MRTVLITLCSLWIALGTQAQDSVMIKTAAYYEENMLPDLRPMILRQKEQLFRLAGQMPASTTYNMEKAKLRMMT